MKKLFCYIIISFIIGVVPVFAHAAALMFEKQDDQNGVTILVKFDPQNISINALEGSITFSKNLELVDVVNTSNIVPTWIEQPALSNGAVRFSGIIPGGYSGELSAEWEGYKPGTLMDLVFRVKNSGSAEITMSSVRALLNDGKATETFVSIKPLTFEVVKSDNKESIVTENDTIPPLDFEIIRSRDPEIFSGKYFVSFNTQDKESGIDSYEVAENYSNIGEDYRTLSWNKAVSPYVLKDQKLTSFVYVKAKDKKGNARVEKLDPVRERTWLETYGAPFSAIIILIVIILVTRFWSRRKV